MSRRRRHRRATAQGSQDPSLAPGLDVEVRGELQGMSRQRKLVFGAGGAAAGAALLALVWTGPAYWPAALLAVAAAGGAAHAVAPWLARRAVRRLEPELARTADIGALIDVLAVGEPASQVAVCRALKRELRRRSGDGIPGLDAGRRAVLRSCVAQPWGWDPGFLIAAVRALSRVGDTADLACLEAAAAAEREPQLDRHAYSLLATRAPEVRSPAGALERCRRAYRRAREGRLAWYESQLPARRALDTAQHDYKAAAERVARQTLQRVRQAAQQALPQLRERVRQQRAAAALLRPAYVPNGEALLRPAETAAEVEAQGLLRPVEEGDD